MRYLIFGTGAIGGYFGGRLLQHGHQVNFIARGKQLAAINKNGLKLNSLKGDIHLPKVSVSHSIKSELLYDVIFIAVKSTQLAQAAADIIKKCSPHTVVVPLLNGVDIEQKLIAYGLKPQQIINAFANIICKVSDYGVIEHSGGEPHITLGVRAGFHNDIELTHINFVIEQIAHDFKVAQVNVSIKTDITDALWAKYLFVAPWAAISSLVEQPLGAIRANKSCLTLLHYLIDEYQLIATAQGANVSERVIENIKKGLELLPPASKTSMQHDVEQQRANEFDTLIESAYTLSKKYALNTPILNTCYGCLLVKLGSN